MTLLAVFIGACVLSLVLSRAITWGASKSPFWNMGFAVVIVLVGAALIVLGLIYTIRRLGF
jgi:hypothetical protein